ncbi:MAG: DUF2304 family protein [Candidatus Woesearchaeota archaeon]
MLIQILLSIFILFAIIRLIVKFKKTDGKISESLLWFAFWVITVVAIWVPDFLTQVANFVGIGRGADLVLYVSVVVVFYLIFKIYVRLEKIERNITKVVRKDSLKEED